jgi:hypothetical protein
MKQRIISVLMVLMPALWGWGCEGSARSSVQGTRSAAVRSKGLSTKQTPAAQAAAAKAAEAGGIGAEVGGSNYVLYSAGEYKTTQTDDVWFRPGVLKPVIGLYHQQPELVRQQLRDMYARGQRKIALFLWYVESIPAGTGTDGVHGHVVDASAGALLPQHKQNLQNLIRDIENTGFTGMQFRFAAQSPCSPGEGYQKCWNFLESTVRLVVATATKLDVIFDLDNEAGGSKADHVVSYSDGFWRDFHAKGLASIAKTYGFSVAAAPGRLTKMVQRFGSVGNRPSVYAITLYDNIGERMREISQELASLGESGKPIIVQETYYNDPQVAADLRTYAKQFGVNIQYVMQWPLTRGLKHFSVDFTPDFSLYHPFRPNVSSAGAGCDDGLCIWIRGKNFGSDAYVDVRPGNGDNIIASYKDSDRTFAEKDGFQVLTFRLKSDAEKNLFRGEGVKVAVVSPSTGMWSNLVVVKASGATSPD